MIKFKKMLNIHLAEILHFNKYQYKELLNILTIIKYI